MENMRNGTATDILSKVYRKAAHLKAQNAPLSDVSTETNLEKLLKLQLANLYQDHEHVVEVIKAETPFFVDRALSYKWFIKNDTEFVTNYDYFEKYLLPNVSCWTRRKLLERLNVHLKNETMCDKYFTSILLRYGIADAMTMLPSCSVNLITSILNEWKVLLTCKQLLSIYNKSRPLAVEYLNTFTVHFCYKTKGRSRRIGILKTYNRVFKQLLIDDPISFHKIYKQFCNYYGEEFHLFIANNDRMKLNKKLTRDLLIAYPQFATENAEICFELLYLEMLFENLPLDNFTKFCSNILPNSAEDITWSKMYLLVRKMKAADKFIFIKNLYETKYQTVLLNNHDFNNSMWFQVMPSEFKTILFKKYSTKTETMLESCTVNEAILLLQNAYDMNKDITYKCTLLDLLSKCVANEGAENVITEFIFELFTKRNWEIISDKGQTEVKIKILDILAEVWTKPLFNLGYSNKFIVYSRKLFWPRLLNRDYIENQLKFFLKNNLPIEAELIRCLAYRQMNYYAHNLINRNNCRKLDINVFATLLELYAGTIQKLKYGETKDVEVEIKELLLASLTVFVFGKIWHKADSFTLCDYPPLIEQILINLKSLQKSDTDLLFKWLRKDKKARIALPNMIFELHSSKCRKVDKVYILEHILKYQPKLLLTLDNYSLILHYSGFFWRNSNPNYRNFLTKVMLLYNDTIGNHFRSICKNILDSAIAEGSGGANYVNRVLKIQTLLQDHQANLSFLLDYLEKVDHVGSHKITEVILSTYSESDLTKLIKDKVLSQTPSRFILKCCSAVLKTFNGFKIVVDAYNDEAHDNKIKDSIIPHVISYCVCNVVPTYLHRRTIKQFFNYIHDNCKNSLTHDRMISLVIGITDHSLFTFELELIDIATSYLIEFRKTRMEEKCSVIKYLGLCLHFSNKLYEDNILKLIRALVECLFHHCDICYDNDDLAVHFIQQVAHYLTLFSLATNRNNLYLVLSAIKSHWSAGNTANTELFMYISIWLDLLTLYFKSEKEWKFTRHNANEKLVTVWREFGTKCGSYIEEHSAPHTERHSDMYRDASRELVVFLGSNCISDIDMKLPRDCREAFVEGLTGSVKRDMEFYFKTIY